MQLSEIFSKDIMSDHSLVAVYLFCAKEVRSVPGIVKWKNRIVRLEPYELLLDFDWAERELSLSKDAILEELAELADLNKISMQNEDDYLRVRLKTITFPINEVEQSHGAQNVGSKLTFRQWVEIDLRNKFKPKTLEMMRIVFRGFVEVVQDRVLLDIGKTHYRDYVSWLQNKGVSNTSINDYIRTLKASLNRAVEDHYLTVNPFKRMRPLQVSKKPPIILEPAECEHILRSAQQAWLQWIIEVDLLTGMRRGEITHLKWKNIDFPAKKIMIRCDDDFRPKGDRERDILCSSEAMNLLDRVHLDQIQRGIESKYVFVDEKGLRIKDDRLTRAFKNATGGLRKELTFHALRRTYASKLNEKGAEHGAIRDLLGHSNDKTTLNYVTSTTECLQKAVGDLGMSDYLPGR